MARAYGIDLRERVIDAASEGISVRQAAARFEVGISTAIVWVRRFRERGERAARKQGKPCGSKLDIHKAFLLGLVEKEPDITLEEMGEALLQQRGFKASLATLWRFFDARAITFKKNRARFRAGSRRRGRSTPAVVRHAAKYRRETLHLHR